MQARLIKGIQKPRPEFETVGACLIMLHGISDAGANFECWYVEFLGHQEQHLEFIDAAAAHMSAYDDNPRAQARAILRMDGADLRTRNEEELATLSSKCLTTWTRAIIRGMKGGTGFKAGNAQRRGCGDNTQDGGLAPPSLVCSFRAKVGQPAARDFRKNGARMSATSFDTVGRQSSSHGTRHDCTAVTLPAPSTCAGFMFRRQGT